MREIKFRAWDGKKMFNVDVLAISKCGWSCPDYGYKGVSLAFQPSIKVMQYTGLKDKNGVEIYEGDIIQTYFSFDPGDAGYGVSQKPFVVDWNQEHASFRAKKPEAEAGSLHLLDIISFFSMQSRLYEVIGNIHENPELLEAQPCG